MMYHVVCPVYFSETLISKQISVDIRKYLLKCHCLKTLYVLYQPAFLGGQPTDSVVKVDGL